MLPIDPNVGLALHTGCLAMPFMAHSARSAIAVVVPSSRSRKKVKVPGIEGLDLAPGSPWRRARLFFGSDPLRLGQGAKGGLPVSL